MTKEQYLQWLAPRVVLDSLERGLLPSPRIAQGLFECAYGTSQLAVKAKNLFGVKANDQWDGDVYSAVSGECYNGKDYVAKASDFQAYGSWEDSIFWQGWYLENRCTTRKYHPELKHYAELIGNRDYKDCARILQEKHYGTSPEYAKRVVDYIERHNLTRYDSMTKEEAERLILGKEVKSMKINIHAGHNPDGKTGSGAVGIIRESTENRKVAAEVIAQLRALGHTVYDCTVDDGTSAKDVLRRIVKKCNAHAADLDVSIHFNAGAGDRSGNGKTTGTEVYIYKSGSEAKPYAERIAKEIAALGFRNRGVKVNPDLYVLKNTEAPALLVECCFVDDQDDVALYDAHRMAAAIVKGIAGQAYVPDRPEESAPDEGQRKELYRVQVGAFSVKGNADAMEKKLKASGFDTYVVHDAGFYKVQVGVFSVKANADAMKKRLETAGFTAIIVRA